jgi:hypothetical protein
MNYVISFFHKFLPDKIDRKLILGCVSVLLVLIIYLPMRAVETQATAKKLIEYGWNAPTPDFFRKHIKEMEQRPFDGVMVKLNAGKEIFTKAPYSDVAFVQDRKDLAATKSSQLTDNFIVMWSGMDTGWDWFSDDDWNATEKNVRNFAKTAAVGSFRGVAFDSEPYRDNPWTYKKQPQQQSKTFPQYQQQVRKRGAQFMKVLQKEQPGTQFLTFGLLSWMADLYLAPIDPLKLPEQVANYGYGLWPAFINGMLDVADSRSVIIDGHEWAYYFSRAASFDKTRNLIFKNARVFVEPENHGKYDKNVKLGQAVYSDLVLDLFPNQTKDPRYGKTMPHFLTSEDRLRLLEHNIYHSLRTSDRYSWLYSESADWWKNKIPEGAETVMRSAKIKIQKRKSLGFNIDPAIREALKKCKAVNTTCQSVS